MSRRTEVGRPPESRFGAAIENAFGMAKDNPLAVLLMAAGAGWLVHTVSKKRARNSSWHRRMGQAERIPVLNTGHARIYDPDASPLHPTQDSLESRREMSARI
jgi:hypothetical protein